MYGIYTGYCRSSYDKLRLIRAAKLFQRDINGDRNNTTLNSIIHILILLMYNVHCTAGQTNIKTFYDCQ